MSNEDMIVQQMILCITQIGYLPLHLTTTCKTLPEDKTECLHYPLSFYRKSVTNM